jgi:hypothetical protein
MGRALFCQIGLWAGFFAISACTNVGDYSSFPGECYEGTILPDPAVRQGFAQGVRLTLTLDVNALAKGSANPIDALPPGTTAAAELTTSDGRFVKTPVNQMSQVPYDALSQLQFLGGRVRNFLAFAALQQGIVTVVVSLMENEEIEVRLLKPPLSNSSALFGVFRLNRKDTCASPK